MNLQENFKKRVLLRGPFLTQSGYGVHSRQIAKWVLERKDLDVEIQNLPWGDTPWLIDKNLHGGLIGKIMERSTDPSGKFYDTTIQIQLPNEWDPRMGKFNVGITAGVETDKCNPAWIANCNAMSTVVVPSKHTADCFKNTGEVKVPLKIIPESFSESIVDKKSTTIDGLELTTPFNFLIFGQITGNNPENDRKNIFYTIKWLCEVFKDDPDVGIVIKTNAGRNTEIDKKIVAQTIGSVLATVRKSYFPKIHLLHGNLTDDEVASLYRNPKIKALVSLTRGEGYGLPILEAAASDLPVIATGWSGHVDFLSKGKYIDIASSMTTIHQTRVDNSIFMPDSRWASPSEEDFKKKILKFKNGPTIPKEWAQKLGATIRNSYSIDAIIKIYDEESKEWF